MPSVGVRQGSVERTGRLIIHPDHVPTEVTSATGFTELPTLIVLGVLFGQWQADERRLTRRLDRRADRDGDAELSAYNERLAVLSRGGNSRP